MNLLAHILIFGVYAYSLFVDVVYVNVGHTGFGWRFKYLTFINLVRLNSVLYLVEATGHVSK